MSNTPTFKINDRVTIECQVREPLRGLHGTVTGYGNPEFPDVYAIRFDEPLTHPDYEGWTTVFVHGDGLRPLSSYEGIKHLPRFYADQLKEAYKTEMPSGDLLDPLPLCMEFTPEHAHQRIMAVLLDPIKRRLCTRAVCENLSMVTRIVIPLFDCPVDDPKLFNRMTEIKAELGWKWLPTTIVNTQDAHLNSVFRMYVFIQP